jgi:hypothetical protein
VQAKTAWLPVTSISDFSQLNKWDLLKIRKFIYPHSLPQPLK